MGGGGRGMVLRADHDLWPFWSRTILCAILKDLPPTQRCIVSVSFEVSAIGSASVQQLYSKCHLIVWAGGRISLQSLWERQFENILLKHGWEKVPNWECLFVHSEKGLFLSVCVDDIKLAGKKQNLDPMWKLLNKEVDLGEPTSFVDHVYLGCTQRQCEISKDIVDNYRTMFESRISAE